MSSNLPFKRQFNFDERLAEAKRVLAKHPDKVPIICERASSAGKDCPFIDKKKYLAPNDLTVGQFLYVIRRQLRLPSEKALFLFVNNTIPPTTGFIKELYERYKENDMYLYLTYSQENTFG